MLTPTKAHVVSGYLILTQAMLLGAGGLAAQDRTGIPEILCNGCAIVLDTLTSIPRAGSIEISDQMILAAHPDGMVLGVDPVHDPHAVLFFSTDGELHRSVDMSHVRFPGRLHFDAGGGVVLVDERSGALYRVPTEETDQEVETRGVDNPFDLAFLGDGRVLVSATSQALPQSRYALHLFAPGDSEVQSFDRYDERVMRSEDRRSLRRHLAVRPGGGPESVWAAHPEPYRLDLWNLDTGDVERFERDPPWWVEGFQGNPRLSPPPPSVRGVWESADGHLWVVAVVAAEEWEGYDLPPDAAARVSAGEYPGLNRHLRSQVFDSVLEVIDTRSMEVIARRRLDGELWGFVGPGVLMEYRSDSNETGWYEILVPRLVQGHDHEYSHNLH